MLGRVTYDSFAGAWPQREVAGGEDSTFAAELGDLRKIVATRGSQDLGWRNADRSDDIVASVAQLRADDGVGKVLVAGSLSVVRQLLAAGLLDELRLLVHPVAAGSGEHLFDPAKGSTVLVVTFIALLELAKETLIEITQAEAFAPIYVRLAYTPV